MKKSFQYIKEVAGKYEYLNDFRKNDMADFVYAKRHGWLEDLTFLKKKFSAPGTYTYERCRDIAKGCRTRSEFHEKCKMAYRHSLRNGWIDDFGWLKKTCPRKPRGYWTLERTRHALTVCVSLKELMEKYPGARSAAYRYGIYGLLHDKNKP